MMIFKNYNKINDVTKYYDDEFHLTFKGVNIQIIIQGTTSSSYWKNLPLELYYQNLLGFIDISGLISCFLPDQNRTSLTGKWLEGCFWGSNHFISVFVLVLVFFFNL